MTEAAGSPGPTHRTDFDPAPAASPPVGPELAAMNLRILALRTGWPDGAIDECEKLQDASPGWSISWSPGGNPSWAETGYYATRVGWHVTDALRYLHGATVDELAAAIEQHPLPQHGLADYRPLEVPSRQDS
jgi:hypothetical protein